MDCSVKTKYLNYAAGYMNTVSKSLRAISEDVESVAKHLEYISGSYGDVAHVLIRYKDRLSEVSNKSKSMKRGLRDIADLYEATDKAVGGKISKRKPEHEQSGQSQIPMEY